MDCWSACADGAERLLLVLLHAVFAQWVPRQAATGRELLHALAPKTSIDSALHLHLMARVAACRYPVTNAVEGHK